MDYVTKIISLHLPQCKNWWCLFGTPISVSDVTPQNSLSSAKIYSFSPGDVFGLSHQQFNEYGLTEWEIWFLRARRPGEEAELIPGVKPGASILLYTRGKKRAKIIQDYLGALASKEITPAGLNRIHSMAAPYLERGVLPDDLISRYMERRDDA